MKKDGAEYSSTDWKIKSDLTVMTMKKRLDVEHKKSQHKTVVVYLLHITRISIFFLRPTMSKYLSMQNEPRGITMMSYKSDAECTDISQASYKSRPSNPIEIKQSSPFKTVHQAHHANKKNKKQDYASQTDSKQSSSPDLQGQTDRSSDSRRQNRYAEPSMDHIVLEELRSLPQNYPSHKSHGPSGIAATNTSLSPLFNQQDKSAVALKDTSLLPLPSDPHTRLPAQTSCNLNTSVTLPSSKHSNTSSEDYLLSAIPEVVVPDSDIAELWAEVRRVNEWSITNSLMSQPLAPESAPEFFNISGLPICLEDEGRAFCKDDDLQNYISNRMSYLLSSRTIIGHANFAPQLLEEEAQKLAVQWRHWNGPNNFFQDVFFQYWKHRQDFSDLRYDSTAAAEASSPANLFSDKISSPSKWCQWRSVTAQNFQSISGLQSSTAQALLADLPAKLGTLDMISFGVNSERDVSSSMLREMKLPGTYTHGEKEILCASFLDAIFTSVSDGTYSARETWYQLSYYTLYSQLLNATRHRLTNKQSKYAPSKENIRRNAFHFGYIFDGLGVEVWEMKFVLVSTASERPSTGSQFIHKNAGTSSQAPLRKNPIRFNKTPRGHCRLRRICVLDLRDHRNIMKFQRLHSAIMTWGHVKHGTMYRDIIKELCLNPMSKEWKVPMEEDWMSEWLD